MKILAALQNGAKHYIVKPFSHEKVIEVVNEVLNLSCNIPQNKYSITTVKKQTTENLSPSTLQQLRCETITRPFFIECKEGVSVVNISQCFCKKYLPALKLGIQRLTLSKPIKVVFNFGDIEVIEEDSFNEIKNLFQNIVSLGGSCIMTSSNQDFVMNISKKDSSLPIKLYSGKLEPPKPTQ
jgi:hypothetical protein